MPESPLNLAAAQFRLIHHRCQCVIFSAGAFIAGVCILVAWALFAWKQRKSSRRTEGGQAADPLLSLLLLLLSCSTNQPQLLTVALQAAVYDAGIASTAVALMSGRWMLWLLLWEVWVWSCYCSVTITSTATTTKKWHHQHHHYEQQRQLLGSRQWHQYAAAVALQFLLPALLALLSV